MALPLSVFIITYNSGAKFEACLKSVAWIPEIIVVDSSSTDETLEIARRAGAKIFTREFQNYADQKNYALSLVKTPWALSLDSDEVVTPELKEEILKLMESGPQASAYRIRRESFIFGRKFRFTGTQDDAPVRLLKTGSVRFEQPIHEILKVAGVTSQLSKTILHYTYDDIPDYLKRLDKYTTFEARYLAEKNAPLSLADFLLRPPVIFFRLYILKQGVRDGWEGFLFSFFSAAYALIKYAKYRELKESHVS